MVHRLNFHFGGSLAFEIWSPGGDHQGSMQSRVDGVYEFATLRALCIAQGINHIKAHFIGPAVRMMSACSLFTAHAPAVRLLS